MKKLIAVLLALLTFTTINGQIENKLFQSKDNNNLLMPISVTIGGAFIVNGSFSTAAGARLDHFVTTIFTQAEQNALGGLTQIQTIKRVTKELNSFALRNITLKRTNGDVMKIDLLKFRLTGDFKFNPYLMNDDVIIFPAYDHERNIIDINGAVNKPIKFQFVDGDKLSDAILFAGGLNNSYDNVDSAQISRLDNTGNKEELITVSIKDDYPLQSGDRIKILADENQKMNYKVLVLGEIKKPGFVYVKKDGSYLKNVIDRAGGFTSKASLEKAEVIRNFSSLEMLKKYSLTEEYLGNEENLLLPETQFKLKQIKNLLSMARLSNINEEDSLTFNIDNQLRSKRIFFVDIR